MRAAAGPGRAATVLGAATVVFLAVAAFTPISSWLHARLREPGPAAVDADAIVVLGSGVMPEGELSDHSLRRLVEGVRLQRRGVAPLLVVLGPSYGGETEAGLRARLAGDLGVAATAIVVEPEGRTTAEEAVRVAALLRARRLRRVALVTGVHHLPRARRAFAATGLEVVAVPVSERSGRPRRPGDRLALVWVLAQEAAARLLYRAAGAF
ncbi:MAG TPA: YdcF family protein [Vicinamibacteria bacterium]|nr:YdcF family protein [Vicinamibacteria bacterium]